MKALGAALLLSLLPAAAFAAAEGQPVSGTVDPSRVVPPAEAPSTPIAPPSRPAEPSTPSPEEIAPRFVLSEVRFDGATTIPDSGLASAWLDLKGKPVSLRDLRGVARKAEGIYAAAGYPFVAIVVTPQAVADGVVHLRVVEGHISNLTVLAKDPVARRQATAAFAPLVDRQPLAVGDVDAAYQEARSVPGLAVAGALRRGDVPGGMDLVVQATRQHWRVYANVNDLYPDTVGPWGALLGVDYFGDSAWGDQTSGQFYTSLSSGRQYVVRLSHQRWLNAGGTNVSAMVLFAWADPSGVVAPLDLASDVQIGRIALAQPIYRRGDFKLEAEGAFEVDDQRTRIFKTLALSTDKLQILSGSLTGEWRPSTGGDASLTVEIRKGVNIAGASRPGDPNLSRFGADPQATVGQFRFSGETPEFYRISLAGRLEGQVAGSSLTAPDQYAIGNLSMVRGYQPGSAFGDSAIAGSIEIRFGPFPVTDRFRIQPFGFYDAARLWVLTPGAHSAQDVASYGGGIRVDAPGLVHLELMYAQPDRPFTVGGPTPKGRVLLNLTVGLNAVYDALAGRSGNGGHHQ